MLSTEGRFFAGYNSQTMYQTGEVGSGLDPPGDTGERLALGPTSFTHHLRENEWSPGIEIRADLQWQWTRHVSFGAGWTGLWMDGIARASNLINYEFGTSSMMGILGRHNRQDVFINGADFRIIVNR